MREKTTLDKILFLDIETVPQTYQYSDLEENLKSLFESKTRFLHSDDKSYEQLYSERAGIYAEFGKIVCISVGYLQDQRTGRQISIKSFVHEDEETLLSKFAKFISDDDFYLLCGHNSKEFDFPYICRRMLINGLPLPRMLDLSGKKPWEVAHIDTMELWKFGDYKAYTSLALLCHVFGIPTSKDDISGADVARVYYEEENIDRIRQYCEKDVVALIQLYLRMHGEPMVDEGEVHALN